MDMRLGMSNAIPGTLRLAIAAACAELGALIVLSIPEARTPEGASVWSWYWPLANTLYFLGLIAAAIAAVGSLPALAGRPDRTTDRGRAAAAVVVAVLAFAINRLAPWR